MPVFFSVEYVDEPPPLLLLLELPPEEDDEDVPPGAFELSLLPHATKSTSR